MPLYDYGCEECGHALEVMHRVNDAGPERCERCGGRMRKLLSPPAIVFKGSGWAKKDARAARPTGAKSGTDTDADSRPSASDDGKADKSTAGTATAESGGTG
jgi:putative FmdB family regulatory protein